MNSTINRQVAPSDSLNCHIQYIAPEKYHTESGIPIYLMRNQFSEAVKIDLIFDAGSIHHEIPVAGITTGLLLAGTETQTMAEINDKIDDFGGFFNSSVSADEAFLSIYGLNESILTISKIIEEALFNASFPEAELTHLKRERIQQLKVSLEKVSILAQRSFQAELFKDTPYGRISQEDDFSKIQSSDVHAFFKKNFKKGLKKINWVGNPSQEEIQSLCSLFSRWSYELNPTETMNFNPVVGLKTIEKEGALQTAIRMGKLLFDRSHPDYHHMTVLNTVFGDYFGSRLMSNIREDKGYTYGIGSYLLENQSKGYMLIGTEVGTDYLQDTLQQIESEMHRLQTEMIPWDELNLVKNYLSGQFLRSADGPFAMMELHTMVETRGLTYAFYEEALEAIQHVTPEILLQTAQNHLNFKDFLIVTAG